MKRMTLATALIIATAGAALAQAPATDDPHHPPQATIPAPQSPAPQLQAQPGQTSQNQPQPDQTPSGMMSGPMMQGMMQGMMKTMQGMMQAMQQQTQPGPMGPGRMQTAPMRSPQSQDRTMMMNCPMMPGTTEGSMQGMMQMMQGMMQMMQMMQGQMQSGQTQPMQPGAR